MKTWLQKFDKNGFVIGIAVSVVAGLVTCWHRQEAYADCANCELPITERLADTVLSLPIGPHLLPTDVARYATL